MLICQFIMAILVHVKTLVDSFMHMRAKRDTPRKMFTGMTLVVMSFIGIGAGLSAGTLMHSIRASRDPSDRGRVTFFEVSTEGKVLLASLLFSGISLLSSWLCDWSDADRGVVCGSAGRDRQGEEAGVHLPQL